MMPMTGEVSKSLSRQLAVVSAEEVLVAAEGSRSAMDRGLGGLMLGGHLHGLITRTNGARLACSSLQSLHQDPGLVLSGETAFLGIPDLAQQLTVKIAGRNAVRLPLLRSALRPAVRRRRGLSCSLLPGLSL